VGLLAWLCRPASAGPNGDGDQETIELTGTIRDFQPDHPDFDIVPPDGFGEYMWNVATVLASTDRPVFVGGGFKVESHAHNAAGLPISWTLYDADLGDTPAVPDEPDTGSITSADTFDQWFQDLLGLNMSLVTTITGVLEEDGEYAGMYHFNYPQYYPIDDMLLGNDGPHNNFFTVEFVAEFVHDTSENYVLMFKSDDDAFVFLEGPEYPDGTLIADLGGINGSAEQWVEMNRLALTDDVTYTLRLFKADRSSVSSRLELTTNIPLVDVPAATMMAMFD
jgi:fibro-slime domain-containing protein